MPAGARKAWNARMFTTTGASTALLQCDESHATLLIGMRTRTTKRPAAKNTEVNPKAMVAFADAEEWSTWLASRHQSSLGVWLKIAKKASNTTSITYAEAVEVALAWGWIDGQKGKLDEKWWLQRFTPRGSRSIWSKINREKALALIAAGKMMPSGLAEVERAKQDGRWERAYESQSRASVPEDLEAALAKNPRAQKFFATLDSRNRYAVLFRVQHAKRAETRARRIAEFVDMLAKGEKLHP
jgi:uncharacterized protein YdeI (YjbR/CyaY-like superfamily)